MRALLVVLVVACGGSQGTKQDPVAARSVPRATAPDAPAPRSAVAGSPDCDETARGFELFDDATDPEWQETFRVRAIANLCTYQEWPEGVRTCLRDASTEASRAACVAALDSHQVARVSDLAARAKSIQRLRVSPAAITCERVAENVHSEMVWTNLVDEPAERATKIAAVRREMTDACRQERWNASTRACLISGAGEHVCLVGTTWSPWRMARRLPVECRELRRAIDASKTCRAMTQGDRDKVTDWWHVVLAEVKDDEESAQLAMLPELCDAYGFRARKKLGAAGCTY
ncbi:MAG TPA: hypothetical protein VMZ53_18130 [Kofleriaceae bacterium]|nr:hypothetical protein [Kofleriaceae bacterium]